MIHADKESRRVERKRCYGAHGHAVQLSVSRSGGNNSDASQPMTGDLFEKFGSQNGISLAKDCSAFIQRANSLYSKKPF